MLGEQPLLELLESVAAEGKRESRSGVDWACQQVLACLRSAAAPLKKAVRDTATKAA